MAIKPVGFHLIHCTFFPGPSVTIGVKDKLTPVAINLQGSHHGTEIFRQRCPLSDPGPCPG